ncbi:MAG: hypothetical protein ACJ746_06140 [Bryobacteraceae bacterium]
MLTVHDFEAEQDYQLGKRRLFNRNVYGSGIVAGLDVALENGTVLVSPGFALDPTGNEIIVDRPTVVDTKTCPQQRCFVMLRYTETGTDPVPVGNGQVEFSRVVEGFALETGSDEPGPDSKAVCLARLAPQDDLWTLDTSYARKYVCKCSNVRLRRPTSSLRSLLVP